MLADVSERTGEVWRRMGKELLQRVKDASKSCGRKSGTDSDIKQKFQGFFGEQRKSVRIFPSYCHMTMSNTGGEFKSIALSRGGKREVGYKIVKAQIDNDNYVTKLLRSTHPQVGVGIRPRGEPGPIPGFWGSCCEIKSETERTRRSPSTTTCGALGAAAFSKDQMVCLL